MITETDKAYIAAIFDRLVKRLQSNGRGRGRLLNFTLSGDCEHIMKMMSNSIGVPYSVHHRDGGLKKPCGQHCPEKHSHFNPSTSLVFTLMGVRLLIVLCNIQKYSQLPERCASFIEEILQAKPDMGHPSCQSVVISMRDLGWDIPDGIVRPKSKSVPA